MGVKRHGLVDAMKKTLVIIKLQRTEARACLFLFFFLSRPRLAFQNQSINTKYSEYRDATLCSYVIKPVKPDTGLRLARLVVHGDRDVATLDGVDFLLLRDVFRELAVVAAVHDHGEHGGADEVPE